VKTTVESNSQVNSFEDPAIGQSSADSSEKKITKVHTEEELKTGIKSINLSGDKLIITADLSGVFCQGVQYYDLVNIQFINNNGIAHLIDLLKSLLKQGVEVQFVNVAEKIKEKIRAMGLENVINCR
jgi:ABC-type transporter Mla MlaB component